MKVKEEKQDTEYKPNFVVQVSNNLSPTLECLSILGHVPLKMT